MEALERSFAFAAISGIIPPKNVESPCIGRCARMPPNHTPHNVI